MHVLLKQIPAIDHTTTNHNNLGIQDIDQIRQSNPKVNAHAPEDLEREVIALFTGLGDHLRGSILSTLRNGIRITWACLARHAHDFSRRRKDLKPTPTSARARNAPKRIHAQGTNLSRRAVNTAPQGAGDKD